MVITEKFYNRTRRKARIHFPDVQDRVFVVSYRGKEKK